MLIDLSELLPFREETREYTAAYEGMEAGGFEVASSPSFKLFVTHSRGNAFSVSGSGSVELLIPCARCLEPVAETILFDIDRSFDLQTGLDADGDEISFLSDYSIDTDGMILEEALMNLPIRVLCREDCKGICERCGANLNYGACSCEKVQAPTRMADAITAALNAAKNKK